eukprot:CAMPEP_0184659398 /NCGR_PEP_ID=MMETSP0308-20130426/29435_1 /TAXON_ID=38269 /ORGANISM="Gloeochaete witrockiana, Strain SAG 46.84" /LENGTH=367 /DNA_ID=CAMNT_0027099179 /DNA_START=203 /DNA_END=1306 /DNA_ORIENTATION=-
MNGRNAIQEENGHQQRQNLQSDRTFELMSDAREIAAIQTQKLPKWRNAPDTQLLKAADEVDLGRQIRVLLQLYRVRDALSRGLGRDPTEEEWCKAAGLESVDHLDDIIFEGKMARERLVEGNMRWVVRIAAKYARFSCMTCQDLIQEGSVGLVRAAEKFEPDRGYRFTTYATWWIRQSITRAMQNNAVAIRVPAHIYEKISKIRRVQAKLSEQLGRDATVEEVADVVQLAVEQVRGVMMAIPRIASVDAVIESDGKDAAPNSSSNQASSLSDFLEDPDAGPDGHVDVSLLRDDIETVLCAVLTDREQEVVRKRYGLIDGKIMTLQDLGEEMELTRERVRQIELKALRKLKHRGRNIRLFKSFAEELH